MHPAYCFLVPLVLAAVLVWPTSGTPISKSDVKIDAEEVRRRELEERDRSTLEQWNKLYASVFLTEVAEDVGTDEEIVARFNQLVDLEKQLSRNSSEQIAPKMSHIYKLMHLTRVDQEQCFDLNLSVELNHLLGMYAAPNTTATSVRHYIESSKSRLFAACNRKLGAKLEHDLAAIKPGSENVVKGLIERIKSFAEELVGEDEYFHASFGIIKQGVASYAKELQEYTELTTLAAAKKLISDSCSSVKNGLAEVTNLYNQFICDRSYAVQMDRLSLEWVSSSNICRLITPLINVLTNEALNLEQLRNRSHLESNPHFESSLKCWWLKAEGT